MKLKEFEINERLLKAITSQGGLPPRLALPPPPPIRRPAPPPALGAPPIAVPPPALGVPPPALGGPAPALSPALGGPPPPPPSPRDKGAMQQVLNKARNYLRPVGRDFIFNPKTEDKIIMNNREYIRRPASPLLLFSIFLD